MSGPLFSADFRRELARHQDWQARLPASQTRFVR